MQSQGLSHPLLLRIVIDARSSQLQEALDLDLTRNARLEPVVEELRDLKAVWTALSGVWTTIGEMREATWATVQPRKIRQQIDGLLNLTKEMPSRMRQYAAFEYVQTVLRALLKANTIVTELRYVV